MRPSPLIAGLLALAACRGCPSASPADSANINGSYGHETMTLVAAAHEDRLVVGYNALFDEGTQECACLLDMQRTESGRWVAQHAGQQVELLQGSGDLMIQPVGGAPADLACCGTGWPGDKAPTASRAPLGRCTTVSQAADVFLPVPYVEEPEASDWTVVEGDVLEGIQLGRAFDVWVVGHIPGPGGLVGLVRIEDLDCGG